MFSAHRRTASSVDELDYFPACDHASQIVLGPDVVHVEWTRADFGVPLLEVGEYAVPVAIRGETLRDRVTFLTALRTGPSGQLNGVKLSPRVIHAWGQRAEIAGAIAAPAAIGIVSVPQGALQHAARALGLEIPIPQSGEFATFRSLHSAVLRRTFERIARTAEDAGDNRWTGWTAKSTRVSVIAACARAMAAGSAECPSSSLGLRQSFAIVQSCEQCAMQARFQGVTMGDLHRASGKSDRRIRLAFHDFYGVSPRAYLRIVALHEVRRALINEPLARDAGSRAASDFGFWHLGRFAAQYRGLFGESPSTTLERRRSQGATHTGADVAAATP